MFDSTGDTVKAARPSSIDTSRDPSTVRKDQWYRRQSPATTPTSVKAPHTDADTKTAVRADHASGGRVERRWHVYQPEQPSQDHAALVGTRELKKSIRSEPTCGETVSHATSPLLRLASHDFAKPDSASPSKHLRFGH